MRFSRLVVVPALLGALAAAQAAPPRTSVQTTAAAAVRGPAATSALKLLPVRRAGLVKLLGQRVSLDGFFYDGSIPMVIDDIVRVQKNEMIPEDAYVAVHGKVPAGIKSGDRVSLTAKLVRPTTAFPAHLRTQSMVAELEPTSELKVLKPAPVRIGWSVRQLVELKFPNLTQKDKYAVLVVGGINPANNHLRYWNELKATYNLLRSKGWPQDHIKVLYADGIARDASLHVDYAAVPANISAVFTNLAAKMDTNDTLYIMLNDHGGPGANNPAGDSVLCLWGVNMTDKAFAAEVAKITKHGRIMVEMEQCYSGGFLDDLVGSNRVMMSACSPFQSSWAMGPDYTWNWFTYWYLAALRGSRPDGAGPVDADANHDGKVSMVEAFDFAVAHDQGDEKPYYEDNGAAPAHLAPIPNGTEGTLGASTWL